MQYKVIISLLLLVSIIQSLDCAPADDGAAESSDGGEPAAGGNQSATSVVGSNSIINTFGQMVNEMSPTEIVTFIKKFMKFP